MALPVSGSGGTLRRISPTLAGVFRLEFNARHLFDQSDEKRNALHSQEFYARNDLFG